MIPYSTQKVNKSDIQEVIKTLKSPFLTQGPKVPQFEKALALDASNPEAYHGLGLICRDLHDLGEAEKNLLTAIKLDNDFISAHFDLGRVYAMGKEIDKAAKFFERTLQLDPDDKLGAGLELAFLGKREKSSSSSS